MDVDIFKLTYLCDEYQLECLMKAIEKYLESFVAIGQNDSDITKSKIILRHLKLTSVIGFKTASQNLVEQITNPFYDLQTLKEFQSLNKRAKIWVALKRLRKLLEFDRKLYLYLEENDEHGFPSIIEKHLRDNDQQ